MSDKRESRPRRQPEAGQHGVGQDRADRVPTSDYSNFDPSSQRPRIQNFLGQGKDNAVPGRKLMEYMGTKDLRAVSKAVEVARRDGVPICATTSPEGPGYFIAASPDELSGYLRSLDHRLKEIRATRSYMGDALEKMSGQGRLW